MSLFLFIADPFSDIDWLTDLKPASTTATAVNWSNFNSPPTDTTNPLPPLTNGGSTSATGSLTLGGSVGGSEGVNDSWSASFSSSAEKTADKPAVSWASFDSKGKLLL